MVSTRTVSPYRSSKSATAPLRIASSTGMTSVRTGRLRRMASLIRPCTARRCWGVRGSPWEKSKRRRSGATRDPVWCTWGPARRARRRAGGGWPCGGAWWPPGRGVHLRPHHVPLGEGAGLDPPQVHDQLSRGGLGRPHPEAPWGPVIQPQSPTCPPARRRRGCGRGRPTRRLLARLAPIPRPVAARRSLRGLRPEGRGGDLRPILSGRVARSAVETRSWPWRR